MQKSWAGVIAGSTVMAILLAFYTVNCKYRGTKSSEWSALKNLGPQVNSAAKDEHVTFIQSGKMMIFASTRKGGYGAYDLYQSRFENGQSFERPILP